MGMCQPSGGKLDMFGKFGSNIPDARYGKPNSRTDYYDEDTGELLQQRWYGPDGLAIWDRDWKHRDPFHNHIFPHDHSWDWNRPPRKQRSKENLPMNPDYC